MNFRMPLPARRRVGGVTLIEVLVTMVIVAVGLLGLAGMQVRGLSIQKDAHGRALATQLAVDIADRMRSNSAGVSNYGFVAPYPTGTYTPAPVTQCDETAAAPCTAVQQAQYDLDLWVRRVRGDNGQAGALPGGWARIALAPGSATAWDVTLMWIETGFRSRQATRDALNALGNTCNAVPVVLRQEVECITVRVRP
jgi:type IV pilus assembly protein PilV